MFEASEFGTTARYVFITVSPRIDKHDFLNCSFISPSCCRVHISCDRIIHPPVVLAACSSRKELLLPRTYVGIRMCVCRYTHVRM